MKNEICTDHLGNTFSSKTKMLEYHNIAKTTYHRRLREGMSTLDILKTCSRKGTVCYDHLGNKFASQSDMLNHYGISWTTYSYGIKHGKPLKEILTKNRHKHVDHIGQTFKTLNDMCEHWHISRNSVKRRLRSGWDLDKALTEPQHRFMAFPKSVRNPIVKLHLTVKSHIENNYFLCVIDGNEIVLSKQAIINYAESLIEKEREQI